MADYEKQVTASTHRGHPVASFFCVIFGRKTLGLDILLYQYNNMFMPYSSVSDGRNGNLLFNRIAVLRAERSLSRYDLADVLGINYQTVGYLERGDFNPSLELAFRIAEYFKLPVEAIFSRRPFRPLSEQVYGVATSPKGRSKGG